MSVLLWLGAWSSLMVLYLSTRRGALIIGMVGLAIPVFFKRRGSLRFAAVVAWLLLAGWFLVSREQLSEQRGFYLTRMEFLTDASVGDRISDVFLPIVSHWVKTAPLGNYLGAFGPEAPPFLGSWRDRGLYPVEVGAALLVAEMGIAGALIFVGGLIAIWVSAWRAARRRPVRLVSAILIGYQIGYFVLFFSKEALALSNVSLGEFMFWASMGIQAALVSQEKMQPLNVGKSSRVSGWQFE